MTHLSLTSLKWHTLLTTLGNELNTLDASERVWLVRQVTQIETLQEELDTLFRAARGASACAGCDGTCCGCGRHHVTATNLLAYLLAGETPPEPDFSVTCPFLGNSGCLLPSFRRPYNCITFFCEILEDRLDDVGRERLRDLDRRLRAVYERIAQRYPLASLRGLWIALERAGGGHLLCSPEQDVVE
jgi:hypothetical protein